MNQRQLAELFATSVPNINIHIGNMLQDRKLIADSVIKDYLITAADASQPNMALTSWEGAIVRKGDVFIAKNYGKQDEIDTLNRLTVLFFESAEMRVKERKYLTFDFWRKNVDALLEFQGKEVLKTKGVVIRFPRLMWKLDNIVSVSV